MFNPRDFRAFIADPKNIHFDSQQDNEQIVLLLRRHFVTNLPWIIAGIILILVPFGLPFLWPLFSVDISQYLSPPQLFLLTGFYYLIVFGYVFQQFLLWYFSVGIVTNVRLVDVDFLGFLAKVVSEADLTNIQDISISATGVLALTFNFGDMIIQTQGPDTNVEFGQIPNPTQVQKEISRLVQAAKQNATS